MTVTVTTRAGKGSPLTHAEVDANFTDLAAAVNGAGGGWTQIGSPHTPTGVSTFTIPSIPATYSNLLILVEGIGCAVGADSCTIAVSGDNDSTRCDIGSFTIGGAADTVYGAIEIPGYRMPAGSVIMAPPSNLTADTTSSGGSSVSAYSWRIAGGIDAIRFTLSYRNFDAGTVTLYGK